jgi:hypothetical protein
MTHKRDLIAGHLARIFHELLSRDCEDGRATGQSRGTAGKDGHIRGRSNSFMKYPGEPFSGKSLLQFRHRVLSH